MLLALLMVPLSARAASEAWTWVGGTNVINRPCIYGTKGVAAAANVPGARAGAATWSRGTTRWLFGGYGHATTNTSNGRLNDLWRFDGTNWAWMTGTNALNRPGVYGTQGVPSATNTPGGREGSVSWVDANGMLWLFGGATNSATSSSGRRLNDLWRFDGTNWAWIAGSNSTNQLGVYGTRGIANPANTPGARDGSVSWTDAAGALWLFGGLGYGTNTSIGRLNDLWRFDGTNWTWIAGTNVINRNGTYGSKGVPAAANTPGARDMSTAWVDVSGALWLFGGQGLGASGTTPGALSDLWRFDGTNWTWISGSNSVNRTGLYGTKGIPAPTNMPGGRWGSVSRVDATGRFWLFGGTTNSTSRMNDLWRYDGTNWTWVGGGTLPNQYGAYGAKGSPSVQNLPGSRFRSACWGETNGFRLFGGDGYAASTNGYLNDFWISEAWPERTLQVISSHGVATPPAGITTNDWKAGITNSVTSPVTQGATQLVCTGWTMTGNAPFSGFTNTFTTTHSNHAVLTWNWMTNFFLTLGTTGLGGLDHSSDWQAKGTSVVVKASMTNHWYLDAWTGDTSGCSTQANQLTIPMDRARQIGATFLLNGYALEVTSPHGACQPPPGTNYFGPAEVVTCAMTTSVVEVGRTQFVCLGWTGTGSITNGKGTNTSFTITNTSTLGWLWQTNYALQTRVSGSGTVEMADGWYAQDTGLVIRATPASGWRFVAWTGDVLSVSNPLPWTQARPTTLTAVFSQSNQCAVVASSTAHGTVTPQGLIWVPYGGGTNLTMAADAHYHIENVAVNGQSLGPTNAWSAQFVTNDFAVHTTFAIDTYLLTVESFHGGVTPTGLTTNPWNGLITATVTNSPLTAGGTQFVCYGWTGGGSATSGLGTSVSFAITNDSSLTWHWRTNYWLGALTNGSGSAGLPSGWYSAETNVVLSATPSVGWHFMGWSGDVVSASASFTQTMNQAWSFTALFEINLYGITASAGPNGTISPSGVIWVPHGGSTNFLMIPATNHHVASIKVDGRSQGGGITTWSFVNVTNAHTIRVDFAADIDLSTYEDPFLPREIVSLGEPLATFHIPSTAMWPAGHLLYAEADGSDTTGNIGPFLVYNVLTRQLIYSGNSDIHTGYRCIAVDRAGNAYFSVNTTGLAKYDPASNAVTVLSVTLPGFLRAATRQTASGWIYGATDGGPTERLFRFHPETGLVEDLGDAGGYTTCMVLDPTERYAYYIPDAHGGAWRKGAPLIQFDTQTYALKVIAFLNNVYEPVYGYRLGGSYGLDIDAEGKRIFINMNAQNLNDPAQKTGGFGEPCLVVVHIPPSEATPPETPRLAFEDVAPSNGVRDILWSSYIHTASWGDADGDGRPDLYVGTFVQTGCPIPSKLLLNRGLSFVDAGQTNLEHAGRGSGSVFADFDNDGDLDLLGGNNTMTSGTGERREPSHLYRNENGAFQDVTEDSGISVQNANARQVTVLDYNHDGLLDLFIVADRLVGSGPRPTLLLRNEGSFLFSNVTAEAGIPTDLHGLGAAVGDLTGDGWPEIVFPGGGGFSASPTRGTNCILVANGDGTYHVNTNPVFDWNPYVTTAEDWVSAATFGDLNRDGRLDIVIGHHFGGAAELGTGIAIRVYLNRGTDGNGDPLFEDITVAAGMQKIVSKSPHVEIQDFDNDGWPDIYTSIRVDTTNGYMPLIYLNNGVTNGDPTFTAPDIVNPSYFPGGPVADYDNDGRLDVFFDEWRTCLPPYTVFPQMLMHNISARGNHWLQVKVDYGNNHMGVGARVELFEDGQAGDPAARIGCTEISPSQGFSSSQESKAHFGLGSRTFVDVTVTLPFGGSSFTRRHVPADRLLIMPTGNTYTPARLGLATNVVTDTSAAFLADPGSNLPPHTVASTLPTVDFTPIPHPNAAGNPWSQWGAACFASDGRFYLGIGNHYTINGNAYLYEYDPVSGRLACLGDVQTITHYPGGGSWCHGKLHARITDGEDGYLYVTSYRGSENNIIIDDYYKGSVLLRIPLRYMLSGRAITGDANQNGLPDDWESYYLGGTNGAPETDSDGDGVPDGAEFVMGTHPKSNADYFASFVLSSNDMTGVWIPLTPPNGHGDTGYDRYYALEFCQDLRGNAWHTVPGYGRVPATNDWLHYMPAPTNAATFYRARVWLENR